MFWQSLPTASLLTEAYVGTQDTVDGQKKRSLFACVFTKPKEKAGFSKIPFWWAWQKIWDFWFRFAFALCETPWFTFVNSKGQRLWGLCLYNGFVEGPASFCGGCSSWQHQFMSITKLISDWIFYAGWVDKVCSCAMSLVEDWKAIRKVYFKC